MYSPRPTYESIIDLDPHERQYPRIIETSESGHQLTEMSEFPTAARTVDTAVRNPDGSIALVLFNPSDEVIAIRFHPNGKPIEFSIRAKAIQTILIPN